MTPTKHTPGPWSPEDNVSAGGIVHFAVVAREQTNDWMVCSVTPQRLKREQDVANAKLIAAAPELLEALAAFVDWQRDIPSAKKLHIVMQMATTAILKATT